MDMEDIILNEISHWERKTLHNIIYILIYKIQQTSKYKNESDSHI